MRKYGRRSLRQVRPRFKRRDQEDTLQGEKVVCLSQFDVVTQGCAGLLLPPLAAQAKLARLNRKEKILKLTCNICTTQKKIFIKPKQKTEKKKS